jgi:parvulin-like peptidyl-prolyl isomerase
VQDKEVGQTGAAAGGSGKGAGAPASQRWLIVGAVIGLLVALAAVAQPRLASRSLPPSVVASVNGQMVRAEALDRAIGLVTGDRGPNARPLDPTEILDRLIEEELLVQRALELDLVRSDSSVRRAAVRAVIDSVVLDAESAEIEEEELRDYFDSYQERFTRPATVQVERVLVRSRGGDDDPVARAAASAKLLRAGAAVDYVREGHGDDALAPIPSGPLLLTELREYVGPALAQAIADSDAGEVVGPMDTSEGLAVVRVRERSGGGVADFESNRGLVLASARNDRVNQAMRAYLERLRGRASVVLKEPTAQHEGGR